MTDITAFKYYRFRMHQKFKNSQISLNEKKKRLDKRVYKHCCKNLSYIKNRENMKHEKRNAKK